MAHESATVPTTVSRTVPYHGITMRPRAPDPLGLGLYGDGAHGGMRRGERRTEVDAWRQLGGLDWDGC